MEAVLTKNLQGNLTIQLIVLNQQQAFALKIKRFIRMRKNVLTFGFLKSDCSHQCFPKVR